MAESTRVPPVTDQPMTTRQARQVLADLATTPTGRVLAALCSAEQATATMRGAGPSGQLPINSTTIALVAEHLLAAGVVFPGMDGPRSEDAEETCRHGVFIADTCRLCSEQAFQILQGQGG